MPTEPLPEIDPEDIKHSRHILLLLKRVEKLNAVLPNMTVKPGSRLAGDDARIPSRPVSSYGYAQLLAALGCLESLERMIVRDDGGTINMSVGPYGVYALIRNALDSAASALWLLEPGSTLRVKRRLLLDVDEVRNAAAFRRSMNQEWSEWKQIEHARIQQLSVSAGMEDWNPLMEKSPSRTSILQSLQCHQNDDVMPWLAAWQLASGHAHGMSWADFVSHRMDEVPGTETNVVPTFTVTVQYGMLAVLLFEAVQLIETAGRRYGELASMDRASVQGR